MWPFSRQPRTTNTTRNVLSREKIWPPEEHEERLARYERYRKLYRGEHFSVFNDPVRGSDHDLFPQYYITTNLAAQVSHTAADLLFGEPPNFIAEDGARQETIDRLVTENDLFTTLLKSARGQSYRGDSVFKIRWSPEAGGRVVIESLAPDAYFPIFDPDDPTRNESVWVAWVRSGGADRSGDRGLWARPSDEASEVLRVEVHTPGQIQNLVFPYKNGRLGAPMDLAGVAPDVPEFVATGIDEIPLIHIPNAVTDDTGPFGLSDYVFFEDIQREINNRLSQIGNVLDKHADPNMVIPLQALDAEGAFRAVTQKAWPIDQADVRPEYVTWDGKLDAAFREVELLEELFFMASGISPGTLGVARAGLVEESGRAIHLRQLRTLKWIENKRAAWNQGLTRMFSIAQQFLAAHSPDHADAQPTKVQILWNDGLPTDRTANIEDAVKAVEGGVMSVERGVRLAQGLEGENLTAEVQAIGAEGSGQRHTAATAAD